MRYIIKKDNPEVTYVSGGHFVSNGAWIHPKATLDDYELLVVLKGSFQLSIQGGRREFREGDCFLLFPGEEHCGIEEAWDVSFYWLHFKFQGEEEIVEAQRIRRYLKKPDSRDQVVFILNEICRPPDQSRLLILINQLLYYQVLEKRKKGTLRPCNLMMEMVLHELSQITEEINRKRLFAPGQKEETDMDNIYEYIHANYYKNLQVAELARHFGYNTQYFIRMFRRANGMTPKQYIVYCQIEQSKHLLATTSMKIMEISEQVGISDYKNYLKYFKKFEGICPSKYRKAFRKTHYNSR